MISSFCLYLNWNRLGLPMVIVLQLKFHAQWSLIVSKSAGAGNSHSSRSLQLIQRLWSIFKWVLENLNHIKICHWYSPHSINRQMQEAIVAHMHVCVHTHTYTHTSFFLTLQDTIFIFTYQDRELEAGLKESVPVSLNVSLPPCHNMVGMTACDVLIVTSWGHSANAIILASTIRIL